MWGWALAVAFPSRGAKAGAGRGATAHPGALCPAAEQLQGSQGARSVPGTVTSPGQLRGHSRSETQETGWKTPVSREEGGGAVSWPTASWGRCGLHVPARVRTGPRTPGHQCHRHLEDKSTMASCTPVTKRVLLFCCRSRPSYKPELIRSLEGTPGAAGHGPGGDGSRVAEDGACRGRARGQRGQLSGGEVHSRTLPTTPKTLTWLPAGPPARPRPRADAGPVASRVSPGSSPGAAWTRSKLGSGRRGLFLVLHAGGRPAGTVSERDHPFTGGQLPLPPGRRLLRGAISSKRSWEDRSPQPETDFCGPSRTHGPAQPGPPHRRVLQ